MLTPLISIITPVYNSEKYLNRCVDSIINQTFTNLEIILVDDGSTDGSSEICDEFARRDTRIRVIHKDNKGVSAARNDALDICSGKYVAFIDSDDFVDNRFIEKLYLGILDYNVDLAICGLEKLGGINILSGEQDMSYANQCIMLQESTIIGENELWFHALDSNIIGGYLWNKLFKASILREYRLDTKLTVGEDLVLLTKYLLCVNKAYYIAEPLYKYQMNDNSAMNILKKGKNADKKKVLKNLQSNMDAAEQVFFLTSSSPERIKQYVSYRRIRSSLNCVFSMIITKVYEKRIIQKIKTVTRENYNQYKIVKYGNKIQRIAVIAMMVSPTLLYLFGRLFFIVMPNIMYKISRE